MEKTTPFTTASNNTWEQTEPRVRKHTEHCKTLMRETEQTQMNGKLARAHGCKEHCQNVHSTKSNVHVQSTPGQNSNGILHRNIAIVPIICVETQRPLNSQRASEKGEQVGGISLPDFTLHYQATVTKKCAIGTKTGTHTRGTGQRPKK